MNIGSFSTLLTYKNSFFPHFFFSFGTQSGLKSRFPRSCSSRDVGTKSFWHRTESSGAQTGLVLTLFLGVEYVAYSTFAVLVLPFLSLDAAISFLVHFLSTVASLTHASDLLIAILHNVGDGRVAGLCQAPTKAISTYNMSQPICEKSNQNMSHIQLALQAIEGDATLSLTRAARIYKVPERTLRRRCDGTSS
jgi:hypothetical protein